VIRRAINGILIASVAVYAWIEFPRVPRCLSNAFENEFSSFWFIAALESAGCIALVSIGALCLSSPFWEAISKGFRWFLGISSILAFAFVAFMLIESGVYKLGWIPFVEEPIATLFCWFAVSFPLLFYGQGWAAAQRWLYRKYCERLRGAPLEAMKNRFINPLVS
jgi:hypothetical protein